MHKDDVMTPERRHCFARHPQRFPLSQTNLRTDKTTGLQAAGVAQIYSESRKIDSVFYDRDDGIHDGYPFAAVARIHVNGVSLAYVCAATHGKIEIHFQGLRIDDHKQRLSGGDV